MDPLKRRLITGEWKNIVDKFSVNIKAASKYIMLMSKGKVEKQFTWKNCAGIPEQHTAKDCGYFIMRYMKDIAEDKNLDFFSKWERRGKATYTQQHIDAVRTEWAKFAVKTYM
ncbi:uncharacterized protein LOC121051494 [Rosa chinensis]|nr:uncharacterized protein LOC121051494 [Rosa chinensis]